MSPGSSASTIEAAASACYPPGPPPENEGPTAMSQVSTFLARSFQFNSGSIRMITEGFTAEDWVRPPSAEGGNNAHWILGHIAAARRSVARKLGGDLAEEPWEKSFDMNVEPGPPEGYPKTETLFADLQATGHTLARLLEGLSDPKANEEWGPFPDGGKTVLEGVQFMFFHESYHMGQLGLLRRICGKPRFA